MKTNRGNIDCSSGKGGEDACICKSNFDQSGGGQDLTKGRGVKHGRLLPEREINKILDAVKTMINGLFQFLQEAKSYVSRIVQRCRMYGTQ